MFWNASSTLLASRADVSMKDRWFSPVAKSQHRHRVFVGRPSLTCERLGLLGWHSPQMSQIALVSHQHDDDVRIGVVPQLFKPSCDVLVCLMLADVVDKQCSDGTSIVSGSNRAVSLLAGSIPNLCLDGLGVDLDRSCGKLNTNSRLGIQVELVAGESTKQVGLSDTRVSDQHN